MRAHAHEDGQACPARLAASEETPGRTGLNANGDRPSARLSYWLAAPLLLRLSIFSVASCVQTQQFAERMRRRLLIHLPYVLPMLMPCCLLVTWSVRFTQHIVHAVSATAAKTPH